MWRRDWCCDKTNRLIALFDALRITATVIAVETRCQSLASSLAIWNACAGGHVAVAQRSAAGADLQATRRHRLSELAHAVVSDDLGAEQMKADSDDDRCSAVEGSHRREPKRPNGTWP